MRVDLVVTRHPALLEVLRDPRWGLDLSGARVIDHARPEDVQGKVVAGVLPHRLSSLCTLYIEIDLDVPPEWRGKELSVEQLWSCLYGLAYYVVRRVNP